MRTVILASGANISGCGADGIHAVGPVVIDVRNANIQRNKGHGIFADATMLVDQFRREHKVADSVSDQDIRAAAEMSAKMDEPQRAIILEQCTIGKWASENGWQIAHLGTALAQLGVAILGT